MHTSPLRCPDCGRSAHLQIDEKTVAVTDASRPRRREFRLTCPSGCTPATSSIARLADPMAC